MHYTAFHKKIFHVTVRLPYLLGYTKLLLDDVLQLLSSGSEARDTFTELLNSHLVLVEVKAEEGLVLKVLLLGKVEGLGIFCTELDLNLVL